MIDPPRTELAEEFPHLNLSRWPFDVVPSTEGVAHWVGRPDVGRRLQRLVESADRIPTSRIVLLWATFGSGKTHALRYAEHLADLRGSPSAVYVVVPRGIRSFLDIYKAIVDALHEKCLLEKAGHSLLLNKGPDVTTDSERALVRLAIGSPEEQRMAAAWLHAERLAARDVRTLGLTRRIETVADAVHVLNDVIGAIRQDGPIVLLIDEVQEFEELQRRLSECVGGLHKLFDLNPRGLTIVFSFTTASRATARNILGPALYDRASDVIALPALTRHEAVDFVEGLIRVWSLDPSSAPAPFTPAAIAIVVDSLSDEHGVTPRALIKAFDRILREAEFHIADGNLAVIDDAFAQGVLGGSTQDEFL